MTTETDGLTIAEMLERLGAPQNDAEQRLITAIREIEGQTATAARELAFGAAVIGESRCTQLRDDIYVYWNRAHMLSWAIWVYRWQAIPQARQQAILDGTLTAQLLAGRTPEGGV